MCDERIEDLRPWEGDYQMYPFKNVDELAAFQKWFWDECEYFNNHIDYEESIELCKNLCLSDCYGNAQYLTLTEGLDMFEGVVLSTGNLYLR